MIQIMRSTPKTTISTSTITTTAGPTTTNNKRRQQPLLATSSSINFSSRRSMMTKWYFLWILLLLSSSLCGSEGFDKFDDGDRSRFHNKRRRRRNFRRIDNNNDNKLYEELVVFEEDSSSEGVPNANKKKIVDRIWKFSRSRGITVVGGVRATTAKKTSITSSLSLRGGNAGSSSLQSQQIGGLDKTARSFVIFLAWIVSLQAIGTAIHSYRDQLYELASRFMGHESITAAKNIKTILESCDDHGVIDIFSKYPPQEILTSVFALSRIQSACQQYDRLTPTPTPEATSSTTFAQQEKKEFLPDEVLLEDLTRYASYAAAAYGWKMDLVSGRLHRGDRKALVKMTNLEEEDIVSVNWESKTNLPAYFIVRDRECKRIVLSIRGTWSGHDVLTDLCCTSEEYYVGRRHHKAHAGMLAAARGVSSMAEEIVAEELEKNPGYSLLLVGHSLGGSVAAILGNLWTQQYSNLTVYAYGPACTSPEHDRMDSSDCQIISVLVEGDPFSRLSLGHVADVSCALAHLCENTELRSTILIRTDTPLEERDVEWCLEAMKEIQTNMVGEKLFPPGRLLFITNRRTSTGFSPNTIREVSTDFLQNLRVGPRMFDLSRHIPRLYEARLRECQTK